MYTENENIINAASAVGEVCIKGSRGTKSSMSAQESGKSPEKIRRDMLRKHGKDTV